MCCQGYRSRTCCIARARLALVDVLTTIIYWYLHLRWVRCIGIYLLTIYIIFKHLDGYLNILWNIAGPFWLSVVILIDNYLLSTHTQDSKVSILLLLVHCAPCDSEQAAITFLLLPILPTNRLTTSGGSGVLVLQWTRVVCITAIFVYLTHLATGVVHPQGGTYIQ